MNEIAEEKTIFPLSNEKKTTSFFSFPFFIRALPRILPKKKEVKKSKAKLTRNIPAKSQTKHTTEKHRTTTRT